MTRRVVQALIGLLLALCHGVGHAEDVTVPLDKIGGSSRPRLFVLSLGVARFSDDLWPDLKYTERDAERVGEAFGRGTPREVVTKVLTGKEVTRGAIEDAMQAIARKARSRDAVVVYVSTHGTLAPAEGGDVEPVLVLGNTRSESLTKTGLRESALRAWLDKIPASRKVLMLAACHSGVGKSRLTPRVQELLSGTKGRTITLEDVSEGVLVLAAAARGETAREDDKLKGDVYTHYFLEGLNSFDRDGDGAVTVLEAHDHARERAFAFTGGRQRATLEAQAIGDVDFALRGRSKRPPLPVLEARGDDLAGLEIRVGDGAKGRLPTAVALEDGRTQVRLYRVGRQAPLATYVVTAKNGDRIELEDLLAGDPWSVGIGHARVTTLDEKMTRAIGGGVTRTELVGGYRLSPSIGLNLSLASLTGSDAELRPGVDASFAAQEWTLRGEWIEPFWTGLELAAGASLGRSAGTLTLAADGDDDLVFEAATPLYGLHTAASWNDRSGAVVRLMLQYATGAYDFGAPGSASLKRVELGLGLGYRFGGVARRR